MSDFNHSQYQKNYQKYLETNSDGKIGGGNPHSRVELLKRFLPTGKTILEIGSGGGIEALVLEEAGYQVTASDYAENFVKIMQSKALNAIRYDAKSTKIPGKFDAIYANAVFVHFSPQEIIHFLYTAKDQLENEKLLFISLIKGSGCERSARNRGFERDFYYYSQTDIEEILEKAKYKIIYINAEDEKWIQLIAQSN